MPQRQDLRDATFYFVTLRAKPTALSLTTQLPPCGSARVVRQPHRRVRAGASTAAADRAWRGHGCHETFHAFRAAFLPYNWCRLMEKMDGLGRSSYSLFGKLGRYVDDLLWIVGEKGAAEKFSVVDIVRLLKHLFRRNDRGMVLAHVDTSVAASAPRCEAPTC